MNRPSRVDPERGAGNQGSSGGAGPVPPLSPSRMVIESVTPEIDGGRFSVKRTVGEELYVEADIFADGDGTVSAQILYRHEREPEWRCSPMGQLSNDRWRGSFRLGELGRYLYCVEAWVDPFATWRRDLEKKVAADVDVSSDLALGGVLVEAAAQRAEGADQESLRDFARCLKEERDIAPHIRIKLALGGDLEFLMNRYPDRRGAVSYPRELGVWVDWERASFGSWYEFFPRSAGREPARHGTFAECEARLSYIAGMGFDVVYLPPIHPVGRTNRKGKNNEMSAAPGEPGSPWAIGSPEGGHKSVHPELGTLEDFRKFVAQAKALGLEVALDLAFHTSPDHPYCLAHPDWFVVRPDGTIQYAENPPKKYEDIYPFNFETEDWQKLWLELKGIVLFWIHQGVKIFRADNPHTKPFRFWEWLITQVKKEHPDVIFLSEAFTRPKVMYHLAKLGFTQSYTYFTWRNTKRELEQYFTELTQSPVREFFRPNLWPNTPDILHETLQSGGPPAFRARLVLAATLGANYGIYGPAFELCESRPREKGGEEYLNSEKYELRHWDIERKESLCDLITRVNMIRKECQALRQDLSLKFHPADNKELIAYSKQDAGSGETVIVIVNLDPRNAQSGWVELDLAALGLDLARPYELQDLLGGAVYTWRGARNFVKLDPNSQPAHIFRVVKPAGK
ncbi:MAG: alpha-1,4-glucan--maltose-1-phosphate maltosyltransferase [Candidatus Omnitrophica bacterium]|nr:alpha-1,4-glucan--maltose-1-phosphate maltosyltransferase [Candidatus Omnitrophota bacterium]